MGAASPSELVGKPVMDFVHPDYQEIGRKRIRLALEDDKIGPLMEEKFVRLDGTVIDVEVASTPFTYRGQKAVLSAVRDITDRKRAEGAL